MPCYHLDTCYLIEYLNDKGKELHRHAKSVIDRLHSHDTIPEISEIAVGEFLHVAVRDKYSNSIVMNFYGHLQQNHFKICRVGDPIVYSQLVSEIRNADTWIESTDVLVIAHSMATADCRAFLTFEGKLIESNGLKRVMDKHSLSFTIADDTR